MKVITVKPSGAKQPAYQSQAYQYGIQSEKQVIRSICATPSSMRENCSQDIDYYFEGQSVSLKTQHTALRTGNLAFELSVTLESGKHVHSWFYTGSAQVYHIRLGNNLYSLLKSDLNDYVATKGFDAKKCLTQSVKASQAEIGHAHTDSVVGLIKFDKLILSGILKLIAVI